MDCKTGVNCRKLFNIMQLQILKEDFCNSLFLLCKLCLGPDDASKATSEVLNKPNIAAKLNGKDFVCIKLLKDSEGHQQFAAICKFLYN